MAAENAHSARSADSKSDGVNASEYDEPDSSTGYPNTGTGR